MAYVKLVNEKYPKENDVLRLSWYIYNLNKNKREVYGGRNIFVDMYNPVSIGLQFCAVQYGQTFQRRLYHVVISFDPVIDNANHKLAHNVATRICNLYYNYQSFFAIHDNTDVLHVHMMFNNCSAFDGIPKLSEVFNILTVRNIVDDMIDRHLGIK